MCLWARDRWSGQDKFFFWLTDAFRMRDKLFMSLRIRLKSTEYTALDWEMELQIIWLTKLQGVEEEFLFLLKKRKIKYKIKIKIKLIILTKIMTILKKTRIMIMSQDRLLLYLIEYLHLVWTILKLLSNKSLWKLLFQHQTIFR